MAHFDVVNRINYQLVAGDTASKRRVTCFDNDTGLPIDLTGSTVKLKWKSGTTLVEKTMAIVDAAGGVAEYQFLADEIIVPNMAFEVEITDSAGKIVRSLQLDTVPVRAALAADPP
jgi:hypothetical protein